MRRIGVLSANRNEKRTWRFAAAALSMAALSSLPASAQPPFDGCPAPAAPAQIEVLPLPARLTGDTCKLHNNTVTRYSLPCGIAGTDYPQPEAIYKVWLHDGNNVGFNLKVLSGDLALVLLQQCGAPGSCRRSADGIKLPNESLSSQNYKPSGFYFLYVDAAAGGLGCGQYEVTVTGVNPVPDLVVNLANSLPVVAGLNLTYTLSVQNKPGALDAKDVTVVQTLPAQVSLPLSPVAGCTVSGGPATPKKVTCANIDLTATPLFKRDIKVTVAASTPAGFTLSSTATATAKEGGQTLGDQNPADNQKTNSQTVRRQVALSVDKQASPATATAGLPLAYT